MAKIIIVEDEPMISEIYQKKFSESGYEIIAADSGEQALNLINKDKVDLILLDLIMPKMDGFEVIKNIRAGSYNKDVKIIVFSNLSQKENQEKAMKLGANGFIVKSDYTPSALVKEVTRILNQYHEEKKNDQRQEKNKTNNITVDTATAKRVLLIEDEDIFIEMFGKKLTQDGYIVESANNGVWGLKEALKKKFDIFIIDMTMPAMSGNEIVEKLKMDDKTKNIPIIILTASVEEQEKKKMLELGVNAFFIKTQLIPSELSRKVTQLLKQS